MLLFVLRLSVFLVLSIFHLIESFVFSISVTFPKYLWNLSMEDSHCLVLLTSSCHCTLTQHQAWLRYKKLVLKHQ